MKRFGSNQIIFASWISIFGNAILAVLKLIIGFVSGSYAVIADGIDSSTDIVSSIVTLVAARVMLKPPNIRFPYGYVKADTVATKVLSMVIFLAGAQLAISTIEKFISKEVSTLPSLLAVYVTVFSIVGKFLLSLYLKNVAIKQKSTMFSAMSTNMRADILISVTVLAGLILLFVFKFPVLDKLIAFVVSIFIMYEAVKIFMRSNVELMDGINDPELYEYLFSAVKKVEGAHNPHRARVRKIGAHYMVNLDIEVNPDLKVSRAHEIAKAVENTIKADLENVYDVMVHVEPMGNMESDEKYGITEKEVNRRKTKR